MAVFILPQTAFEKESNDVVPSLAGLPEAHLSAPAGPADPDAASGTPQVVPGTAGGPLPAVGGRRPGVEPGPPGHPQGRPRLAPVLRPRRGHRPRGGLRRRQRHRPVVHAVLRRRQGVARRLARGRGRPGGARHAGRAVPGAPGDVRRDPGRRPRRHPARPGAG